MTHLIGEAVTAVPGEPSPREWDTIAGILLSSLDRGLIPTHERLAFMSGSLAGAYRRGYWESKLSEVDPGHPGPPPI